MAPAAKRWSSQNSQAGLAEPKVPAPFLSTAPGQLEVSSCQPDSASSSVVHLQKASPTLSVSPSNAPELPAAGRGGVVERDRV